MLNRIPHNPYVDTQITYDFFISVRFTDKKTKNYLHCAWIIQGPTP